MAYKTKSRDLSPLNVSEHLQRVIDLINGKSIVSPSHVFPDCEYVFIDSLPDLRWLTGFSGSNGFGVIDIDKAEIFVFTDSRYATQASQQLQASSASGHVVVPSTVTDEKTELQKIVGSGRVGIDPHSVTHARWNYVNEMFPTLEVSNVCKEARCQKSGGEIERIQCAAHIADESIQYVLGISIAGRTERQVQAELNYQMALRGADAPSFPTIVASGENAAIPHHVPGDRVITSGDVVVIDMGAIVDGYHSDMTRTVCVGEPDEAVIELFNMTARAQSAALDLICEGVLTSDVDEAARHVFREAGVDHLFIHGLGHGVGQEIHEDP